MFSTVTFIRFSIFDKYAVINVTYNCLAISKKITLWYATPFNLTNDTNGSEEFATYIFRVLSKAQLQVLILPPSKIFGFARHMKDSTRFRILALSVPPGHVFRSTLVERMIHENQIEGTAAARLSVSAMAGKKHSLEPSRQTLEKQSPLYEIGFEVPHEHGCYKVGEILL